MRITLLLFCLHLVGVQVIWADENRCSLVVEDANAPKIQELVITKPENLEVLTKSNANGWEERQAKIQGVFNKEDTVLLFNQQQIPLDEKGKFTILHPLTKADESVTFSVVDSE